MHTKNAGYIPSRWWVAECCANEAISLPPSLLACLTSITLPFVSSNGQLLSDPTSYTMLHVFDGSSQGCSISCSDSFATRFKTRKEVEGIAREQKALHLYLPSLFLHDDDVGSYSQSLTEYYFTPPSLGKEVRQVLKVGGPGSIAS